MKRSNGFFGIASIFLIIVMLLMPVFAAPESTSQQEEAIAEQTLYGCFTADATNSFLGSSQLVKNAKSVFLYELNTQTLMYAWEPDMVLPPSSFVKILTAIIAIENGDLTSAVTVTQKALEGLPASAVSVDLVVNEVLTLQDLLYCMLVGSANDAAAVIAEHIAGGETQFVDMMNSLASDLGCTGSFFTNAHGLHQAEQVTTARDVAKILEYAMENEIFRTIFTTTEYTVPATNKSLARNLLTGNYMLSMEEVEIYFDERAIGGRTGVANDNTRCLATIAKSGSMELLCVVMGSASVYEEGGNRIRSFGGYNETKTLLDIGFTGYSACQILYDGQALRQLELPGADTLLTVGSHDSVRSVLPENATLDDVSFRYDEDDTKLQLPIAAGDKVGSVEIWYNGLCLAVTDLYAMNDVREQSLISMYQRKDSAIVPIIITLVIVVLLLVGCYLLMRTRRVRRMLRLIHRKIRKRKRRR